MEAQTNLELAKAMYARFAERDMEGLNSLMHPEIVVKEPAGVPYPGDFHGIEGYSDLISQIVGNWHSLECPLLALTASDNGKSFVAHVGFSGIVARTGERFETSLLEYVECREGKIAVVIPYYFDTDKLRTLAGLQ